MNKFENEILNLLVENNIVDYDEAEALCGDDAFVECYDEDNFLDIMGDVKNTHENLIKYYNKSPDDLEYIVDGIREDYEYHHWNVNWWRNNN